MAINQERKSCSTRVNWLFKIRGFCYCPLTSLSLSLSALPLKFEGFNLPCLIWILLGSCHWKNSFFRVWEKRSIKKMTTHIHYYLLLSWSIIPPPLSLLPSLSLIYLLLFLLIKIHQPLFSLCVNSSSDPLFRCFNAKIHLGVLCFLVQGLKSWFFIRNLKNWVLICFGGQEERKKKMMMMTMEGMMDKAVLDDIIRRLLEGKGGKQVQLSEGEIRQLCVNARQIFLSQPTLLEIKAPIRICG